MEKTPEEIQKEKQAEAIALVEKTANEKAQEVANKAIEEIKAENEKARAELTKSIEDNKAEHAKAMAQMQADVKKASQISTKVEHKDGIFAMGQAIKDSIFESADAIKSFDGGSKKIATKAITVASGFSGSSGADYTNLVTDNQLPLYVNPYAPVYLRNIFPNIQTNKSSLPIWKRSSVSGSVGSWASDNTEGPEGSIGQKPEVTPTWAMSTATVDWLAGFTTVPRDILDDVDFMASEIPNVLLYSKDGILAAENKMIVDALESASTAFTDATLADGLEKVLGAAFKLTGEYMTPTHILINPNDYLKYFVLNKASGSGEYDTPAGVVSFIGNQMFINSLIAVPTTELTANRAYVIDASQSRFVNRMNVELKMSEEHSDNFTKNMVTFRAEERVTWFTYNNASILKVTLPTP